MTILARALMHSFPTEYAYFSVIEFEYSGQTYTNHNRMLSNYAGTDGIKTGYVRAAGFHLAASVHRQGHHLVGVIMSSRSAKARDLKMIYLLESAFSRLRPVEAGIAPNRADQMGAGITLQWGVQVGAYRKSASARQSGDAAAHMMMGLSAPTTVSVIEVENQGRTLHRARVVGMSQDDAWRACAQLHAVSMACLPVKPGGGFVTFN